MKSAPWTTEEIQTLCYAKAVGLDAACGRSHTSDGLCAALGLAAITMCANQVLAGNTDDGDWNKWTNKPNRHGTDCTGFLPW